MLRLMMAIGAAGAVVMIGIVAFLSFTFWYGQGTSPEEKLAYGLGAAICEIGKALAPFFLYLFWREGRFVAVIAGTIVWLLFVALSLTSAIGIGAENRLGQLAKHETAQKQIANAETTLKAAEAKRHQLGTIRPTAEIEAELDALMRLPMHYGKRYRTLIEASASCARPDAITAEACKRAGALRQELERARAAEALDRDIAKQRQDLAALTATTERDTRPDRQSSFLSRRLGWLTGRDLPDRTVLDALIMLIATAFEAASGWLLYISLGGHELGAGRKAGSVEEFCVTHLVPAASAAIHLRDLFAAYLEWCDRNGLKAVTRAQFRKQWLQIAVMNGITADGDKFPGVTINAAEARRALEVASR